MNFENYMYFALESLAGLHFLVLWTSTLVRCRLGGPRFTFQHSHPWFALLRGLRALSPGQEHLSGF